MRNERGEEKTPTWFQEGRGAMTADGTEGQICPKRSKLSAFSCPGHASSCPLSQSFIVFPSLHYVSSPSLIFITRNVSEIR